MSRRRAAGVLALIVAAGVPGSAGLALARFHDGATTTASFATRVLRPPTDLVATGGALATLAWTPSTSGWAAGYEVLRSATPGSGYGPVGTVTPVAATGATDQPLGGTWYYVVRSTFHGWHSVRSNEASAVVAPAAVGTGARDCTDTQADTGGDGDGYERNPGAACVADGLDAQDRQSGTTASTSCLDAGKDRHRFWGYAFGLPASVGSIDGITVYARIGSNNAMGLFGVCVELSWDGGATWTGHRSVMLGSAAPTTYSLGGPTDAWGRSWARDELDPARFRVRLTDVATATNRRFDLDWIGVEVHYTP